MMKICKKLYEAAKSIGIKRNTFVKEIIKKYAKFAEEKRYYDLFVLYKLTGVKIPEDIVQKVYSYCMDKGMFYALERMYQMEKLKPKVPKDVITKVCIKCIKERNFGALRFLCKITQTKPPEDVVQKEYARYVKKGQLYYVFKIQEATGIKPKLSSSLIKEVYIKYIKNKNFGNIKELQKLTGIKVSKKLIQKAYKRYIANYDLNALKSLYEATKIKPKIDWSFMQEVYNKCIEEKNFDLLLGFREITGVELSKDNYKKLVVDIFEKMN